MNHFSSSSQPNEPNSPGGWRGKLHAELVSLRSRLIILLSLTLIPIGAVAIANAYYGYEHYRGIVSSQALAAGEDAARRSEALIENAHNLLLALAAVPSSIISDRCNTLISRLLLQYPKYSNIIAIAPDGHLICSGIQDESPVIAEPWWKEALNGRPFTVTGKAKPPADLNSTILAIAPLPGEQGHISGVLGIYIHSTAFEQALGDALLPEGAALTIMDRDGVVLAQRSNHASAKSWLPPAERLSEQQNSGTGVFDAEGQDGISRRYLITMLSGNIAAIYGIPLSSITGTANFLLYSNAASAILMWLAALLTAGIAISHLVTRPLRHIRRGIDTYTRDGTNHLTDIEDLPDEIRMLAQTLSSMADTISRRDTALQEAVSHQKALTREVHHRVRNNLQIINSLMSLQGRRATAPSEIAIFTEVQRRVTALGLVHGAIYQGDDMRSVRLDTLLEDLCAATERSMTEENKPALFVHADEITAPADIAVPLAFLVTEVIGETGARTLDHPTEIHISLERANGGGTLEIRADTPLFLTDSEMNAVNRNAISLLAGLARQLGGSQHLSEDRTTITIDIPVMGRED